MSALRKILIALAAVAGLTLAPAMASAANNMRGTAPAPRPTVSTYYGQYGLFGLKFTLAQDSYWSGDDDYCDWAPTPLTLKVKNKLDKKWAVSRINDQCNGSWSDPTTTNDFIWFDGIDGPEKVDLSGEPGVYLYNLLQGGKPILTGWARVTGHWAGHDAVNARVYEWTSQGYNDDYFNFCVRGGKQVYSANHGNFYCVRHVSDDTNHFVGSISLHTTIGGHGGRG